MLLRGRALWAVWWARHSSSGHKEHLSPPPLSSLALLTDETVFCQGETRKKRDEIFLGRLGGERIGTPPLTLQRSTAFLCTPVLLSQVPPVAHLARCFCASKRKKTSFTMDGVIHLIKRPPPLNPIPLITAEAEQTIGTHFASRCVGTSPPIARVKDWGSGGGKQSLVIPFHPRKVFFLFALVLSGVKRRSRGDVGERKSQAKCYRGPRG